MSASPAGEERKPRLLIVSDCFLPRWDGVARFLSQVIPGLADDFEVTAIAPAFPGGEPEFPGSKKARLMRIPTLGIRILDYNMARPTPGTYLAIRRAVSEADVIFVQTIGPVLGWMAILAAWGKRKPVVTYVHAIEHELLAKYLSLRSVFAMLSNRLVRLASRAIYNRTSLIMVPSEEVGELLTWNGVRTRKAVVQLGINLSEFSPPKSRASAKKAIGLRPDTPTIGFLPRLTSEKDPLTLLRAFARLRKFYPNLMLIAIGNGEDGILRKFADQRGVWLLGIQNDVVPYLQAMDINVLPSLTETTSLSTLEAMACGCAVVATPVGYVKEYIVHGKNGFFFAQKDVFGLMRRLKQLLDDKELRLSLAREARSTVEERFDWERTLERIRTLLLSELGRPHAPGTGQEEGETA